MDGGQPIMSAIKLYRSRSFGTFLSEFQGPELARRPNKRQKLTHGITTTDEKSYESQDTSPLVCLAESSLALVRDYPIS